LIIAQMGGTPVKVLLYLVQRDDPLTDSRVRATESRSRTDRRFPAYEWQKEVQIMEELPGCPACGAPATVDDVDGPEGTVEVTCIAHHNLIGPRDLLAPKLRWDVPAQRLPMREELMFAPGALRVSVHRG
jgi:hypothetical protein